MRAVGPLLVALLMAGCASLETAPQHLDAVRLNALLAFTAKDLENAAELARGKDDRWAGCMTALASHVAEAQTRLQKLESDIGKPLEQRRFGLASAAVLAHLAYRDQGLPASVRAPCEPVAVDVLAFLVRTGAIAAPGGGVVNFLLPLR